MIYLRYLSLILLLASIPIFFFGYLPKTIYKRHILKDQKYFKEKTIDKVVLVIVDSLRPDMVYGQTSPWVSLNRTFTQSISYQTVAELQPPSISLPKIKCIVTGAVINYIDIIFNTDAGKIAQDNLIDILREYRNFKFNLYGDETWSKVFPDQFNYAYLTSPFFVHDFFKIDEQVSLKIPTILSSVDGWDFVIMHYLGLDHIGHAVGPYSLVIDQKLSEMDKEIGSLIDGIFQRADGNRTLVILTADHGMSDLGGHGGSSWQELHVPLIFFSKTFQQHKPNITIENIYQNDIAPSLALLLGVPIPSESIGVIPYRLLSMIEGSSNRTAALYSNYLQLVKLVKTLPKSIVERFSNINSSIFGNYQNCGRHFSNSCAHDLARHHRNLIDIMNDIKHILKTESIHHQFMVLELGFILAVLALCISLGILLIDMGIQVSVPGFVFIVSCLCLLLSTLFLENIKERLFSAFKISFCTIVFILTGHALPEAISSIRSLISLNLKDERAQKVVALTLLLNVITFAFPSLIKEEHQVWFYLSMTLVGLYVVKEVVERILLNKEKVQWKSTYVAASLILICDRLLRPLNRTGEKWSSMIDIGHFLNKSENSLYLVIMIVVCLPLVGVLLWRNDALFLSLVTLLLMLLNGIHRFAEINKDRELSDISVWIYYLLILFQLGCFTISKICCKRRRILRLSHIIFLISFLVCRDQNIVLWTVIAIKTVLIHHIWIKNIQHYNIGVQFIIINILGMTSFYQQGNSNSLTTIDVLPGFVGMPKYISFIVNPLVTIQMYSGNLYWILLWLEWLVETQPVESVHEIHSIIPLIDVSSNIFRQHSDIDSDQPVVPTKVDSLFPKIVLNLTIVSSIFTLSIFLFSLLHKHDIMAWSVYAPKLMYHTFQYGITLILYIFVAKWHFF